MECNTLCKRHDVDWQPVCTSPSSLGARGGRGLRLLGGNRDVGMLAEVSCITLSRQLGLSTHYSYRCRWMYNVGLYGGSSIQYETYCVENMYATTCVSFLENEKNTCTLYYRVQLLPCRPIESIGLHGNNFMRKLLTVDVFAAFIVSKRMHML